MSRRCPPVLGALALLLALALAGGLAGGAVSIPLDQVWGALVGGEVQPTHALIVRQIRLPRVLGGTLVGWALAASGTVMQGLFRNPLASPYLLGVASGASAGAAGAIVLGRGGGLELELGAFLGALLAVALVYRLGTRPGRGTGQTLILAGVALGALFAALTSFLIFLSGEQLREIVFWLMGSLGRLGWSEVRGLAAVVPVGTLLLWPFMRELNALALGARGARALGLDPERLARGLLVVISLMSAAAVAATGTIGFVGLITPHALRRLLGPDHRLLLPASALGGALFLVSADTLARTLWAPVELPVGILTAFTGAPFFLYLLLRRPDGGMR